MLGWDNLSLTWDPPIPNHNHLTIQSIPIGQSQVLPYLFHYGRTYITRQKKKIYHDFFFMPNLHAMFTCIDIMLSCFCIIFLHVHNVQCRTCWEAHANTWDVKGQLKLCDENVTCKILHLGSVNWSFGVDEKANTEGKSMFERHEWKKSGHGVGGAVT